MLWRKLIEFVFKKQAAAAQQGPMPGRLPNRQRVEPSPSVVDLDIDEMFTSLVLGVQAFADLQLNSLEKATLEELECLLTGEVFDESVIPRLPSVVPQLLGSLRSDDTSGKHLAEQIGRDPVLVGEVIRIANSAFYQTGSKINSLERAVVILGRVGLQRLIASVVMKPIFDVHSGRFGQRAGNYLWIQSERCSFACGYLARGRYDVFDAYLAGIVCKIGMIVALRILDHLYRGKDSPKSVEFYQGLSRKTKQLSFRIAENWQFPESVLKALEERIDMQDDRSDLSTLGGLLCVADRVSQLHLLVEERYLEDDINRLNWRLGGKLSDLDLRCYAELMRMAKSSP